MVISSADLIAKTICCCFENIMLMCPNQMKRTQKTGNVNNHQELTTARDTKFFIWLETDNLKLYISIELPKYS